MLGLVTCLFILVGAALTLPEKVCSWLPGDSRHNDDDDRMNTFANVDLYNDTL